jgi:hypothetical protein
VLYRFDSLLEIIMGAWGSGLQANDTALDAIDIFEEKKRTKSEITAFMERIKSEWGCGWTAGVLGLADSLLDEGVSLSDLSDCMGLLQEAISLEKQEDELDCWNDPTQRLEVLELFEGRLQGKVVNPDKHGQHNEGLLSKIFKMLE